MRQLVKYSGQTEPWPTCLEHRAMSLPRVRYWSHPNVHMMIQHVADVRWVQIKQLLSSHPHLRWRKRLDLSWFPILPSSERHLDMIGIRTG